MKNQVSDDELVYLVRQKNEEALSMLLFRYHDIRDVLIWQTLKNNRYCGIDYDDLKQVAYEALMLILATYDMRKSCFFSYWKLLISRELRGFYKNHNGISAAMLNTALSYDAGDEYERNYCVSQSVAFDGPSLIDSLNASDCLQRLAEDVDHCFSPPEKAIMAYRMLGYSYEEISTIMHFTNRKLCRLILNLRSKVRTKSKDWL
jgi:DNA-directed RNA polymerase specialized sigma24 family protein